jgi:hypothetical protein
MIDKDLDSILSNIDKESENEKVRSSAMGRIASKQRQVDQRPLRERIATLRPTAGIISFKNGLLEKLASHQECCKDFRAMNVDSESEPGLEEILRQYKYTFIRSVENIEKLCDDYFSILNPHNLEKKARKEYNSFFEGYEEDNKVHFLILREMFIELREFNSLVRKEWRDLAKSIGVINLSSGGKQLFQSLNAIVEKALILCNETAEFIFFLSQIIGIPEDRQDLLKAEIFKLSQYHEEINYEYEAIFEISGSEITEVENTGIDGIAQNKNITAFAMKEQDINVDTGRDEASEKASEKELIHIDFTVRGTRPWNTREPYVIRINDGRLIKEQKELEESFYFIQRPIEEKALEGEVKRYMLIFLRDRSMNILDAYGEFILKTVFMKMQEIVAFFEAEDILTLFAYHMGPYTAYQVLADAFASEGIGFCYKYAAGNKVVRHLPSEFIKEKVLEWFEHNVNVFDLPFDGIQEYENIRKIVSKKYFASVDESYKKLDELLTKTGAGRDPKFDKQALFKSRWKEWFGASNIIVYNRFLEKTIFK